MEHTMSYRWSITVAAVFMMGGFGSAFAELPGYEVRGFSVTPHQLVVLGPAQAEQELPAIAPTMDGMPASPHQIAVLTPRRMEAKARQEHAQALTGITIGQVR